MSFSGKRFNNIIKLDGFVKSYNFDGKVKSSKFKAREFRVLRRTYRTPQ